MPCIRPCFFTVLYKCARASLFDTICQGRFSAERKIHFPAENRCCTAPGWQRCRIRSQQQLLRAELRLLLESKCRFSVISLPFLHRFFAVSAFILQVYSV